jgi:hypothetical protein
MFVQRPKSAVDFRLDLFPSTTDYNDYLMTICNSVPAFSHTTQAEKYPSTWDYISNKVPLDTCIAWN